MNMNIFSGALPARNIRSPRNTDMLFFFVFIAITAFNLWKVPYGTITNDESLYLAIPYRFMQGDSILFHEWNPSQMSALLLLPPVKLYYTLVPSGEGIYLAFRYLYICFHSLTSIYMYIYIIRSTDELPGSYPAALTASAVYLIYSYSNIMALSYNSMSIGLMVLVCLTMRSLSGELWKLIFVGIAFSGAVLCCPYLVLCYMAFSFAVFFRLVLHRRIPKGEDLLAHAFSLKSWAVITGVCFCLASAFCIFAFVGKDISLLKEIIPRIMYNNEHPQRTFVELIKGLYGTFYRNNSFFKPVLLSSIVLCAVITADKKRCLHRALYLIAASSITLLYSATYLLMYRETNVMLLPFSILGFFAYLLCEKKDVKSFVLIYIPGAILCFCFYLSSNMGVGAISGVSAVSMIASIIFVFRLLGEMRAQFCHKKSFARYFSIFSGIISLSVILILFGGITYTRALKCFREDGVSGLTERVTCGSAKGLKTTPEKAADFELKYSELSPLREIGNGNVLYFSNEIWRYLEDPKRCASSSMWLSTGGTEQNLQTLSLQEKYWELFPEKFPDYVYIRADLAKDPVFMAAWGKYEYTLTDSDNCVILCMNK